MASVLDKLMLLEVGGEIRVGDGAPGVNFTGIRIYKTTGGFRFETYDDDVLQLYIDEHGQLRRGDGSVLSGGGTSASQDTMSELLASNNVWRGVQTFLNAIRMGNSSSIGTVPFLAGMLGSGTKWYPDSDGRWNLEVDKLRVRGPAAFMEILFQQIRATNGSIWCSSTGKVKNFRTAK